VQKLLELGLQRVGTLLHADLYDAVVLASGANNLLAFPMIVRKRLFDVHVFATFAGPDCRQCVPVVARGDNDGIDLVVLRIVEHFPHVGIGRRAVMLFRGFPEPLGIGIAQRGDSNVFQRAKMLEQFLAAPTAPDETHVKFFIQAGAADPRGCKGDAAGCGEL
jgi:hypothetical protein